MSTDWWLGRPGRPIPVAFGSAHLLVDRMPPNTARALLEAAVSAGASRLDTAPLYGHGGSEVLVAAVAATRSSIAVTTKVGLEPVPAPPRWRAAIGSVARRMPPSALRMVRNVLRRDDRPDGPPEAGSGRFGIVAVQHSIERSLARLAHLDRLLLHEVHPADITDDLLELLAGYQRRGDVASLGVATSNAKTLDALCRSGGLFTVAHVSVDPLAIDPPLSTTSSSVRFAGHGALGPGGRTLAAVRRRFQCDPVLHRRWTAAVAETPFANHDGPAYALLARAAALGPDELLVSTRSVHRVAPSIRAATGLLALPPSAAAVLDTALLRADRGPGRPLDRGSR